MKYPVVFCLLMLFLFGVGCGQGQEKAVKKIDKSELQSVMEGPIQLLDVRTPQEYTAGHIEGAKNFNVKDSTTFVQQIQILDKKQPVYMYCKMGGRSAKAAKILKEQGFSKIYDYSGGYTDWVTE